MTIYEEIARKNNVSPNEVYNEIQLAIDVAWNSDTSKEFRKMIFPNGKPTPEEFIEIIAKLVS